MDELIKKLAEERDEWRDKFHALNQTAGELCNACGWAFKIPGESCRCEVIKERDEARANYQWMVNRACDEKLDGYRELGAKCAQLEEERDEARAEVDRLMHQLADATSETTRARLEAKREVEALTDERDELLVRVANQDAELRATREAYIDAKWTNAYRRGAEAMREACIAWARAPEIDWEALPDVLEEMPIPEEP